MRDASGSPIVQVVKLTSFAPFKNAAHALDEVNAISEAVLTDDLKNFLEVNLPKVSMTSLGPGHPTAPFKMHCFHRQWPHTL